MKRVSLGEFRAKLKENLKETPLIITIHGKDRYSVQYIEENPLEEVVQKKKIIKTKEDAEKVLEERKEEFLEKKVEVLSVVLSDEEDDFDPITQYECECFKIPGKLLCPKHNRL